MSDEPLFELVGCLVPALLVTPVTCEYEILYLVAPAVRARHIMIQRRLETPVERISTEIQYDATPVAVVAISAAKRSHLHPAIFCVDL